MTFAVYDANVVVSAIFWPGAARPCLKAVAARQVRIFITESILDRFTRKDTLAFTAQHRRQFPILEA